MCPSTGRPITCSVVAPVGTSTVSAVRCSLTKLQANVSWPSARCHTHPPLWSPCSASTPRASASSGDAQVGGDREPVAQRRGVVLEHSLARAQLDPGRPRRPGQEQVLEPIHDPVAEREDAVAFGLLVPAGDEPVADLGVLVADIVVLGDVGAGVEEVPVVRLEVVAARDEVAFGMGELVDVVGDHLPAVLVHRPAAPALVVLARPGIGGVGAVEHRSQGDAVQAHLGARRRSRRAARRRRRSSSVGNTSMAWQYWWRISPAAASPAGQEMMSGSRTPPSNV